MKITTEICKQEIVKKCCTKEFFVENQHLFSDDLIPVSEAQVIKNWRRVSKEKGNGVTIRMFVCVPYSIENLHKMAKDLNIGRWWFHKDHYDIPLRRVEEIKSKCAVVSSKMIVNIIRINHEDIMEAVASAKEKYRI